VNKHRIIDLYRSEDKNLANYVQSQFGDLFIDYNKHTKVPMEVLTPKSRSLIVNPKDKNASCSGDKKCWAHEQTLLLLLMFEKDRGFIISSELQSI